MADPVTLKTLRDRKRAGVKIPMLTCYDATTARWLARGGVDVLLVGDSAAQMIFGHDDTRYADLDLLIALTAAVRRGAGDAFIVGDLPFGSYHRDGGQAVENACRMMTEGTASAVKIEVDGRFESVVERLDRANVPVVAHVGWRPQRHARTGVPVVAGRGHEQAEALAETTRRLVGAGAVMVLLEQATDAAAEAVVEAVDVPVIGCGAGPACDGHVVVLHDWLGLSEWQPRFAAPATRGGDALADLARRWCEEVTEGRYLAGGSPYG